MKYFTKAQVEELRKQLATLGVRDTDLPYASAMNGDELIAIVQDGVNKKVGIRDLFLDFLPDDFVDQLVQGESAYEIAVRNGYQGTEAEWLASLKGADGEDGAAGAAGAKGDKGDKGDTGATGAKGDKGDKGDPGDGSDYELLPATAGRLGGVIIGSGLNVATDGTISTSLPIAGNNTLGGIMTGYQEKQYGNDFAVRVTSDGKAYVVVSGISGTGGGSNVVVTPESLTGSTVKIATITVDGIDKELRAPVGGGGSTVVGGYIGTTSVRSTPANQDLTGISSFMESSSASLSKVAWNDNLKAWHFSGNLYADGWVAAGGVGSGSGGGSGSGSTVSVTQVVNSGTKIATITVDGTGVDLYAPTGGGSGTTYTAGDGIDLTSNVISVAKASSSTLGGIKTGYTNSGSTWKVQVDASGNAYVDVPGTSDLSGTGTVTSVGLTAANGSHLNVTGSTITTSGSFEIDVASGYSIPTTAKQTSWDALVTLLNGVSSSDVSHWTTAYGWGNHASAGYLTQHQTINTLTVSPGTFSSQVTWNPASGNGSFNVPATLDNLPDGSTRKLSDYVTITGAQDIIGPKTFKTNPVTLDNVYLLPKTNNTCAVGSDLYRFGDYYGVDMDLSGDLELSGSTSTIKIGNAYIAYDYSAKALRVYGTDGASTVGFYCDGFVAAGGVA